MNNHELARKIFKLGLINSKKKGILGTRVDRILYATAKKLANHAYEYRS